MNKIFSSVFFRLLITLLHNCLAGWFARDPSILHRVGHVLLELNSVDTKRSRRIIFADDLFQLSQNATQRTTHVIGKAIENMSGCKFLDLWKSINCPVDLVKWVIKTQVYRKNKSWPPDQITNCKEICLNNEVFGPFGFADRAPEHMNLCQYIVSKVPSLKRHEQSTHQQNGASILNILSSVMLSLQRYSIYVIKFYHLICYAFIKKVFYYMYKVLSLDSLW